MSASASRQSGSNQSSAEVWDAQVPFLQQLMSQGQQIMGQQGGGLGPRGAADATSRYYLPGMQQAGQNLFGMAQGVNPMQQQLGARIGANNAPLEAVIRSQADDITRSLQEDIMPAITSAGIQVGGLGGSRDALARGVAGGEAARAIGDQSASLRYQDLARQDQLGLGLLGSQQQAVNMVPGFMSAAHANAQAPWQAQWAPAQNFSSIIGRPVLESMSQGNTSGRSKGIGL